MGARDSGVGKQRPSCRVCARPRPTGPALPRPARGTTLPRRPCAASAAAASSSRLGRGARGAGGTQWLRGASGWPACAGCCSTSQACCTTAVRAAARRSQALWRRWRGEWAAQAASSARRCAQPGPVGRCRGAGRGCCSGPAPPGERRAGPGRIALQTLGVPGIRRPWVSPGPLLVRVALLSNRAASLLAVERLECGKSEFRCGVSVQPTPDFEDLVRKNVKSSLYCFILVTC